MPTLAAILLNFLMALSPLSCSVCDSIKDCYHDAASLREASAPTLNTTAAEIYYFHQDHLGSSAWITDSLGLAVQHLGYLPWGERHISQKTGNLSTIYTFSGKERDEETGYSYFGQRFYDSELSFWLSVDPMRGKYPNMSPFVYCANNPIKLVDPNGMEIEYNSFADRIRVWFAKTFNLGFRQRFNDLKNSEETYVFKQFHSDGNGSELTTDGDKLFINYNTKYNKEQGTNAMDNLRHETEHAVQFEYGEFGFDQSASHNGTWENSAVQFDATDEVKARNFGYGNYYSFWKENTSKGAWIGNTVSDKKDDMDYKAQFIKTQKGYESLSIDPIHNSNSSKIKSTTQFMMPYKKRNYGSMFNCEIDSMVCGDISMFPYYTKFINKDDNVYMYHVYSRYDYTKRQYTTIDSVKLIQDDFIKINRHHYLTSPFVYNNDTLCGNLVFRHSKHNKWFKTNNNKWFNADYELIKVNRFSRKYVSIRMKKYKTIIQNYYKAKKN